MTHKIFLLDRVLRDRKYNFIQLSLWKFTKLWHKIRKFIWLSLTLFLIHYYSPSNGKLSVNKKYWYFLLSKQTTPKFTYYPRALQQTPKICVSILALALSHQINCKHFFTAVAEKAGNANETKWWFIRRARVFYFQSRLRERRLILCWCPFYCNKRDD